MIEKQFLGSLSNFGLSIFPLPPTRNHSPSLESRGATIEDENRLGAQEQELANSTKEAKQMGIADHFSLLVPHRLHKLHHPYTGICENSHVYAITLMMMRLKENQYIGLGFERERGMMGTPIASFFPARVSTETRRPTGASSSQRPFTPIVLLPTQLSLPRCPNC